MQKVYKIKAQLAYQDNRLTTVTAEETEEAIKVARELPSSLTNHIPLLKGLEQRIGVDTEAVKIGLESGDFLLGNAADQIRGEEAEQEGCHRVLSPDREPIYHPPAGPT